MKRIKKPVPGRRSAYLASVEPDFSLRQDPIVPLETLMDQISKQVFISFIIVYYRSLLGEIRSCTHYRAKVTILEYFQVQVYQLHHIWSMTIYGGA